MTEHQILMLRRHLERSVRSYETQAQELLNMPGDDHTLQVFATMANVYRFHAADAQRVIDKLNVGQVHVQD